MKKLLLTGGLIAAFLALAIAPSAVTADVPAAVAYLTAQTPGAWTTMALAAAGQTGLNADHLKTVSGTLATDYAKAIIALAAIGENPATFGNIDYLAKLKAYYNNNQFGDETLVNDDIWTILALAAVNDTAGAEFSAAKDFIISHQNADGGWSYSITGSSDTNDTAAAIMALVEAGVGASDAKIVSAVNYLKSVQNADGGFPYSAGDPSDSGSDAWAISAIYKIGQNPAGWNQGAATPVTHLESLQDTDGGFWWQAAGTSGNNKAMTPFAVIALSGNSYPVAYYQAPAAPAGTFHLRIEGQTGTLCDTDIAATTALNIVENAAAACGYAYTITASAFGDYLSAINAETAAGMSGWMYFVNNISPAVGAADYVLAAGDSVLWYYGDWGWNPTRITLDKTTVEAGETANATIEYFNGTAWLPLPNATIMIGTDSQTGTADGHLQITQTLPGTYQVYVQSAGFVRSPKVTLQIGAEVSQSVGLTAEVDQGPGTILGSSIAIVVTPTQLNFGKLQPGQSNSQTINIANTGTVSVNLGSTVSGDSLFTGGITIDNTAWSSFSAALSAGLDQDSSVTLTVPADYLASGVKNGELIIWANGQ